MADQEFDVVVIGAGPAGEVAAGRCSEAGLETAIIERELVGGECSYWACIPSKALLRPGEILSEVAAVPGAAEKAQTHPDAVKVLEHRNEIVSDWDDSGQLPWLEDAGVKLIRGRASFEGPREITVRGSEGNHKVTARRSVIVATGSHPAMPPIEGLRDIAVWGNREATSAKQVPRRFIVLGGGPVGVEMAQAWRDLGAEEVTVVEAAERLLPREEPFASEELAAAMEEHGIRVRTGTKVVKASRSEEDGSVTVTLEDGSSITGDELLVAVGRRPNTEDLGLETIGLEPGSFIEVDERMRSTQGENDWLYAIGDVNGRALLTHVGKYQARMAADHIAGDEGARIEETAIPRVTFTNPQVAAVGLTHAQAVEKGMRVRSVTTDLSATAGASVTGVGISGKVQATFDTEREVMIGATFTGPAVSDMLHAATIAIVGEVPVTRLRHAVPSFPTVSEVWLHMIESFESGEGES